MSGLNYGYVEQRQVNLFEDPGFELLAQNSPALKDFDNASRYAVCVRYNARKGNGQYAGAKDSLVLFRNGRLDRMVDNGREACKDAAYQPFPELEKLTR